MSSQKNRIERIEKILCRIAAESSSGAVIIVEGRKDEETLRRLGLTGPIVCFKSSGMVMNDFLSQISAKKVILLTDFDREGKELSARMGKELAHLKIATDDVLRRRLSALVKQDIGAVEGLCSFLERKRVESK
jgi:5S rRNA maturation endonuclease (ribonuclease M5)